MSKITFAEDPSSRKVIRFLLILQVTGMILVVCLRPLRLASIAFAISILTLLVLAAGLVWLYLRYLNIPIIREKNKLRHLLDKFQKNAPIEGNRIRAAAQERERLLEAEQEEIELTLHNLQMKHIQAGLAAASIYEASIPGVGARLKERLAEHGILSAAQVTEGISAFPGFGNAEHEALISWRRSELEHLERTRPAKLTERQVERIQQKYQALQEKNGAVESKARSSKELLEYELMSLKPRLRELGFLTFPLFLSKSLASQGLTAGLLAFGLIAAQMVSAVSATSSMFMGSPRETIPNTGGIVPEQSSMPEVIETSTETVLPSPTETPLQTLTSTVVPTSANTFTPQATLPAALAACIPENTLRESALVVGVVDGDTIDVSINGQTVRVRYIGIDTPEQDQPLFSQAMVFNASLVGNKTVTLVKDTSETDSFGRLLRYVMAGDIFVNRALVEGGYAEATAYAPDTACIGAFEAAQRAAQTAQVGLWMATPEVLVPIATAGDGTAACDPSYPGVCIPPAPPDLDCGEISFRRFQVLSPDPHGFDRDGDGVGCES